MLNQTVLIGRLTKDPELRRTQSDIAVASFTIAVDRPYQRDGQKEADFIPIIVWRKQAENCEKYLSKGSLVAVVGRIQTRSYEKDGQKRYITEIVANSVKFLPSGKKDEPIGNTEGFTPIEDDDDTLQF